MSHEVELPQLTLEGWEPTKSTLHLWCQIVGKARMASSPPRNHWWHVTLYVNIRGLTTRRLRAANGGGFQIDFDFVDHRLVVRTNGGAVDGFDLHDRLSVAEFDDRLHATLRTLGIDVPIRETPYGVPVTTPFPDDRAHAAYDRDAVVRFWRILDWTEGVFEEFAGWFCGKTSPVHLFWHSLDLAVTRFSGRRQAATSDRDPVSREAYTHEVISFGFWPGDDKVPEPSYYSYTSPQPPALHERKLVPREAHWTTSLALLPYDVVRESADPRSTLLGFLESAYRAGADSASWDQDDLRSSWCPTVPELDELLGIT